MQEKYKVLLPIPIVALIATIAAIWLLPSNEDLWTAVHENNAPKVEQFINAGQSPNMEGRRGQTVLHLAAFEGYLECAQALINAGADVGLADDDGQTPLHMATGAGPNCTLMVKALLSAGADPNARNVAGETPLHGAAGFDSIEAVMALVESGAEVDAKDAAGRTPLFWAVMRANRIFIEFLVEHGASVTVTDAKGQTLADVAAENPRLVTFLEQLATTQPSQR